MAFHVYLQQKNVILSGPKGKLPASALVRTVCTFIQDGASPPLLENIALDWDSSPFSLSHWNVEAISILSLDFYNNLKGGAYQDIIFNKQTMNLQTICKSVNISKCPQVMAHIAAKEEKHWKGDRMIACCHGVCYSVNSLSSLFLIIVTVLVDPYPFSLSITLS